MRLKMTPFNVPKLCCGISTSNGSAGFLLKLFGSLNSISKLALGYTAYCLKKARV